MRVAVLGGGLQGCTLAMALADRGVKVTLIDRNSRLLARAASANEGKIHLGYMYASDPTLRTAKAMLQGALSFGPIIGNLLGIAPEALAQSKPATYVVHRETQRAAPEALSYLDAVHDLICNGSNASDSYFGVDFRQPLRRWNREELRCSLNPDAILAAVDTPEVAIDPVNLADLIRKRVLATPNIEVLLGHHVETVTGNHSPEVLAENQSGRYRDKFDHVVNALWDGRIAIDASRGNRPHRQWIHRLKYGVVIRGIPYISGLNSITIISGPFGEVVVYGDGSVYLTWYPACLTERTLELSPPIWPIEPDEPIRSVVLRNTLDGLSELMPALREISQELLAKATVRGGPIVAWGKTDIDDPFSELHQRFEIGVTTDSSYHSIDPGKLTCAPLYAMECANRILV